jgi:ABC-type dipeptide/oligopeptide/nickel transport system permease subunit
MLIPKWHLVVFPGIAIVITVLAFNVFGDGLRDALDPRLRGTNF